MSLLKLLSGKDVLVSAIDVATERVETPEEIAGLIAEATKYVPRKLMFACANCGMPPMKRDVAVATLQALIGGAALARERLADV